MKTIDIAGRAMSLTFLDSTSILLFTTLPLNLSLFMRLSNICAFIRYFNTCSSIVLDLPRCYVITLLRHGVIVKA